MQAIQDESKEEPKKWVKRTHFNIFIIKQSTVYILCVITSSRNYWIRSSFITSIILHFPDNIETIHGGLFFNIIHFL